jgi:hypothetical protein
MNYKEDARFVFFGSALALGATVNYPSREFLKNQTSAVLGEFGGNASQTRDQSAFLDIVKTGTVTATVSGDESPTDHVSTVATSTIEKLDIMGIVKADRIVCSIASVYPKEMQRDGTYKFPLMTADPAFYPMKVQVQASLFENLTIYGKPYEPRIVNPFIDSMDKKHFRMSPDKAVCDIFDYSGQQLCQVDAAGLRLANAAIGSTRICTGVPYPNGTGLLANIPEFGKIYLGEFQVSMGRCSLTMMRVELSGKYGGNVTLCGSSTNGHPIPGK